MRQKKKNWLDFASIDDMARIATNMAFCVDHTYVDHVHVISAHAHSYILLYYTTMAAEHGLCALESSSLYSS